MSNPSLSTYFNLSEKQAILLREKAQGANNLAACLAAGYKTTNPDATVRSVLRSPQALAALHIEMQRLIQEDATVARRVLAEMLANPNTSDKIRSDIAVKMLDRAGHIPPRARQADGAGDKTLNEMTLDELKATQERLQNEILNRARTVNALPTPSSDDQDVDMLG